jgi:hypothetical protein
MIFVGQGSSEQGHYSIPSELIDRAFISVNFVHEELEAAIHYLVNSLWVQLLGNRGVVCDVGKENRYKLTFTLDGASGGKDSVGQMFRSVGVRFAVVSGGDLSRFAQIMTAQSAKPIVLRDFSMTFGTPHAEPPTRFRERFSEVT